MIHFTCDLCGKTLVAQKELRYVVKIDVYSALNPMEMYDEELDKDPLEEVSDLMPGAEEMGSAEPEESVDGDFHTFRYDLCPACYAEYVKNPLGRPVPRKFGITGN